MRSDLENWQVRLWDAINDYRSGNLIVREKAVVKVERIVRDSNREARLDELRRLVPEFCADCEGQHMGAAEPGRGEWWHEEFKCDAGVIHDRIAELEKETQG